VLEFCSDYRKYLDEMSPSKRGRRAIVYGITQPGKPDHYFLCQVHRDDAEEWYRRFCSLIHPRNLTWEASCDAEEEEYRAVMAEAKEAQI
jgi:hypothetical protein